MRHFRAHHYAPRTFFDVCSVDLSGHKGCGDDFLVEVEFTATPYIPARGPSYASGGEPACGDERELVRVLPFEYAKVDGIVTTKRVYLDCPPWLAESIKQCIDVNELTADWSDEE